MAAETAADTSNNPWPLLRDELEFVTRSVGSSDAAKTLILWFLSDRKIRWHYARLSFWPPWTREAARQLFWFADPDFGVAGPEVDWDQSSAVRRGPPLTFAPLTFARITTEGAATPPGSSRLSLPATTAANNPGIIFNRDQQSRVEAFLISLCHEDVLRMLDAINPLSTASVARTINPLAPKEWYAQARKDHPQKRRERVSAYARRLYNLAVDAHAKGLLTEVWEEGTFRRELTGRK